MRRKRKLMFPFRKSMYKFKISHQCIFCKLLTIKKKLIFAPITNYDEILVGDTIDIGFHIKCLKDILVDPEKYSTKQLRIATYLPQYLRRLQEEKHNKQEDEDTERQNYITKAKEVNLTLFLDESTGRILIKGKK